MATTDHVLPRLSATAAPSTPVKPASTVVLIDDDHPMAAAPSVPRPRPAKRSSDDYKHSHMLAERKRRKEMKGVFEQLAALLPPTGPLAMSTKRSKWETLVDTIDYLDGLEMRKRALITKIKAAGV
jgi:hypothetical protein